MDGTLTISLASLAGVVGTATAAYLGNRAAARSAVDAKRVEGPAALAVAQTEADAEVEVARISGGNTLAERLITSTLARMDAFEASARAERAACDARIHAIETMAYVERKECARQLDVLRAELRNEMEKIYAFEGHIEAMELTLADEKRMYSSALDALREERDALIVRVDQLERR